MLAIVALFALLLTFAVPRLGVLRTAALRSDARLLASSIEWARQRAAVTGKPHLVRLDLPNGSYRVEWRISEEELADESPPWPPPLETELGEFRPIPEPQFGRWSFLDSQLDFEGVEIEGEFVTGGDVELFFDPDGSTDPAAISIIDGQSGGVIGLEVRPMIDAVRIFYDDA